jgi:hypothetical protein
VFSHYLLPFKSQWYQAHLHTFNYSELLTGISKSENKISQAVCFTHNNFTTFHIECYKQGLNKFINILRQSENFGSQVSSHYQNLPEHCSQVENILPSYRGDFRFKTQPTDMLCWWRAWCFVISPYSQIPGQCLKFPYMWQLQFREDGQHAQSSSVFSLHTLLPHISQHVYAGRLLDSETMKQTLSHEMNVLYSCLHL